MPPVSPASATVSHASQWPPSAAPAAMFSTLEVAEIGAVRLVRVGVAGTWQLHQPGHTEAEEMLLLAIQRSGVGRLLQSGSTTVTAPGDMVLFSNARPYTLECSAGFEQLIVQLPPAPLRSLHPGIDSLAGIAIRGQQTHGAVLNALATSCFEADRTGLPAPVGQHLVRALHHALAACAGATLAQDARRHSNLSRFHLDRIRQYVLGHIGDSELSVNSVVAALGISAAHLHRLFATSGRSFGTWLWETRLQLCHLALRDPAFARVSISRIAFHFGYSHAAHFSRAYRNCYGMTPSAWRRGAA